MRIIHPVTSPPVKSEASVTRAPSTSGAVGHYPQGKEVTAFTFTETNCDGAKGWIMRTLLHRACASWHAKSLHHAALHVQQHLVCQTASGAEHLAVQPLNTLARLMAHVHLMFSWMHDRAAACMNMILGTIPECAVVVLWCITKFVARIIRLAAASCAAM